MCRGQVWLLQAWLGTAHTKLLAVPQRWSQSHPVSARRWLYAGAQGVYVCISSCHSCFLYRCCCCCCCCCRRRRCCSSSPSSSCFCCEHVLFAPPLPSLSLLGVLMIDRAPATTIVCRYSLALAWMVLLVVISITLHLKQVCAASFLYPDCIDSSIHVCAAGLLLFVLL